MPWEAYHHIRQGWNCGKKTDQKGGRPKLGCGDHAMPVFYRDVMYREDTEEKIERT